MKEKMEIFDKTMEEKIKQVNIHGDDSIISINNRKRLNVIREQYPNIEIIIGAALPEDKPVSIDLAEMEHTRQKIFDAATESVLGKRIDRLDKKTKFPMSMMAGLIGFLLGVAACFYVYNI